MNSHQPDSAGHVDTCDGDDTGAPAPPTGPGGHIVTEQHAEESTPDGDVALGRPEPLEGYEHL